MRDAPTPEEAYAKMSFVGGADRQDVLQALREQRLAGRREGARRMERAWRAWVHKCHPHRASPPPYPDVDAVLASDADQEDQ